MYKFLQVPHSIYSPSRQDIHFFLQKVDLFRFSPALESRLQETLRAPGTLLRPLGAHPGLQRGSVLRRGEPRHGGAVQLRLGAAGERPGGGEDLLLPGRGGTSRRSDDMDLTLGDSWGIVEVRVGRYLTAFEEARSENMDIDII